MDIEDCEIDESLIIRGVPGESIFLSNSVFKGTVIIWHVSDNILISIDSCVFEQPLILLWVRCDKMIIMNCIFRSGFSMTQCTAKTMDLEFNSLYEDGNIVECEADIFYYGRLAFADHKFLNFYESVIYHLKTNQ